MAIVDIVMPGIGGIEVVERLALSHPSLPVLIISGFGEHDLAKRGLPTSCSLLRKPLLLLAEVRRCLELTA
jgi:YesN/AraC family two-component response regulator